MAFSDSRRPHYLPPGSTSVKIVVLGAFGVGKTTLVETVSEIRPLRTEERLSQAGQMVDDLPTAAKTTTTVAMDFGRRTLAGGIVVYMFGAPGQPRFADMIRSLLNGALGGIVLVDTRHVDACYESIGLLEEAGLPYVIAINDFPQAPVYPEPVLRDALSLPDDRPMIRIDARARESAKQSLIALVKDVLSPKEIQVR
ncbi:ATP/GTP-binding protein [Streptomyces sp. NPDC056600]|uniref:GTP-binding protein n=1 Tax=Streptomyces sp. NPDC056600 TaxID=3345874 RepID=UPI00368FE6EB